MLWCTAHFAAAAAASLELMAFVWCGVHELEYEHSLTHSFTHNRHLPSHRAYIVVVVVVVIVVVVRSEAHFFFSLSLR